MYPDWVSSPGPLTYKSDALPTALRDPALLQEYDLDVRHVKGKYNNMPYALSRV